MDGTSSFGKKILIFLLVVGAGVGIFFGVRYFFFSAPNTEKPFEIVNDFVSSELYNGLETNLMADTGTEENETTFSNLSIYEKAIYKASKFSEGISDVAVKGELNYTIGRLQDTSALHLNAQIFLDYELKNILYLEAKPELNALISKLGSKQKDLNSAADKLEKNIKDTFATYVNGLSSTYSDKDLATYFNNMYLRDFTSLYINYVCELTNFCSIAQNVISYSSTTLDTNEYKIKMYEVGSVWANICAEDLKNAYVENSRNTENADNEVADENGKISRTPLKIEYYNLYTKFYNSKIKSMDKNEKLILDFEKTYDIKYQYENESGSTTLVSSYAHLTNGLNKLNLRDFFVNLFEIRTELENIGVVGAEEPAEGEEQPSYISKYLQTLSFVEMENCKETFVRLLGDKVIGG